jgi:hypothetical protein
LSLTFLAATFVFFNLPYAIKLSAAMKQPIYK